MKSREDRLVVESTCRSPHGERGLKCETEMGEHCGVKSLSSRRAWIEIPFDSLPAEMYKRSLSSRRAWIEIVHIKAEKLCELSRSPHGERGLK